MIIKVDIPENKVANFSPRAKKELEKHALRVTEEIIDEASRIEASRRLSDTNSEITQSVVKEAATHPRMYFSRKKNWGTKIVQFFAFISTFCSGLLFDTDKFNNITVVIWFVVVIFVAITTNVYLIFYQE